MKLHLFLLLFMACGSLNAQALIITEIFADPTPSRGLPEREYLEILSRSSERIPLIGYTLTYGNVRTVFPASFIDPGEYVTVCRNPYVAEFSPYGKVIGLSSFSLLNSGNTLVLSDPAGREIHRVSYSSSWYAPGRSEGYSLEMIDLEYPCRGKDNWTSTLHVSGGTPGQPNSVAGHLPDTSPPALLRYDFQENRIVLTFDEVLAESFAKNIHHYEVLPSGAKVKSAAFADETREAVLLTLEGSVPVYLELRVYAPTDCSGNAGDDMVLVFEDLPEPLPGEIALSEILFNPPPGGDDFVEIHNTTGQRFNLKNWQLARLNAAGEVTGHVPLTTTYTLLPPNGWLAFTRNRAFLKQHYPVTGEILEIPALPAYANEGGTVLLLKPDSTVFDRFTYSEKMHASLVHQPKGVSLENVFSETPKWTSASSDAGYATPGAPNSQTYHENDIHRFEAEPRVFHPHSDTPLTWLTYRHPGGEAYAAITVLDRHGRRVRVLARNHLLGTTGKIAWDGTDEQGQVLAPGYYAFVIQVATGGREKTYYAKAVIGQR